MLAEPRLGGSSPSIAADRTRPSGASPPRMREAALLVAAGPCSGCSIGSPGFFQARIPPSTALAVIAAERSTFMAAAAFRPVPETNTTDGRSRSSVESPPGRSTG